MQTECSNENNSFDIEGIYSRTKLVIGEDAMNKIKKCNVCICGIGGVGSFTLEALARIGVGRITIIDKDVIDVTNINRQIIATVDNVGKSKAEVAKKRVNVINPSIMVKEIHSFIDKTNVDKYITGEYDIVIDAIDSVDSKLSVIKRCNNLGIKVISSMGMANKLNPLAIKVADISKTEVCPLAKIMRKKLKEEKISNVDVVYSTELPIKNDSGVLGSISFVPSTAGLIIASEVVEYITNK